MRVVIAISVLCCVLLWSAKTAVYVPLTTTFKTYAPTDSGMVFAEADVRSKQAFTVVVRIDSSGKNVFYDSSLVGGFYTDTARWNSHTYRYYVHKGDTLKARCLSNDSAALWVLF